MLVLGAVTVPYSLSIFPEVSEEDKTLKAESPEYLICSDLCSIVL